MWIFDLEYSKWISNDDKLLMNNFDSFRQSQIDVRFYSKCLSGAVFSPANNLDNIYDSLTAYKPRDWYIGISGSQYSNTLIPPKYAFEYNSNTSNDFSRFNDEYGVTQKTLFTPQRIIKDSVNYVYVDIATTEAISGIEQPKTEFTIDGVRLKEGHRVLVKDQKTTEVLPNTTIAEDYFKGPYTIRQLLGATIEYEFCNEENGIYVFTSGRLQRTNELDSYLDSRRFAVSVRNGSQNNGREFHLSRLVNGYYPVTGDPIEFLEKENYLIRSKVDYNNLFETNYYDVLKHTSQSYNISGITYSLPARTIAVGEFGIILNTQNNVSNIIRNKYKVNLRSITETIYNYWICGDSGTLLKVRKHDFDIQKIDLGLVNFQAVKLSSISFYDELRGAIVGDQNTIFVTGDGGNIWKKITISSFDGLNFRKVLYKKPNKFWIVGNVGSFVEMVEDLNGWTANKLRIAKVIDDEDEYLLVDNINDVLYTSVYNWGLSYSYFTQSTQPNKELLFLVCDSSKIISYDINESIPNFEFIYLDFGKDYSDIINISREGTTDKFYFTGIDVSSGDSGIFSFNLSNFPYIGSGTTYSNNCQGLTFATFESSYFPNEMIDFNNQQMIIAGNDAVFLQATYSTGLDFFTPDPNFEKRLKSKLLVLDYDVAAKLNFFTDLGEYRLPNSIQFSDSFSILPAGEIGFEPLVISATFPSFVTQSEVNWWTYWQDTHKDFEYYSQSTLFDESAKVLLSSTFSYSPTQSQILVNKISNSLLNILPLAPNISITNGSKYNGLTGPAPQDPLTSDDLYVYDYLMVAKVSQGYQVKVGDVIRFSSNLVEGNFMVNKIFATGSNKFVYMITDFNENITNNLPSLTASITNLNWYSTEDEFVTRFNVHPMSYAYSADFVEREDVASIQLDFLSGNTQYSQWLLAGNFVTASSFQIGNSPIVSSKLYSAFAQTIGTYSIETPLCSGVNTISFAYQFNKGLYAAGTFSNISISGLSGSNWYQIYSNSMPAQSVVSTAPTGFTTSFHFNDSYSKFKFDLNVVATTTPGVKWIKLDDIKLSSDSKLVVSATAYGVANATFRDIEIKPKYNYFSAYYNLASNVSVSGDRFTMSYTSGFLNFGYSPTYNLLSYLEGLNDYNEVNPRFTATKEYYALPEYRAIPLSGISSLTASQAYIDYNGLTYSSVSPQIPYSTTNKLIFGEDLRFEWESIRINTFVDIHLYDNPNDHWPQVSPTSTTERALVLKKYFDPTIVGYVIEFNKRLNHTIFQPQYWVDIVSRRKLSQISDDIQELNNIARPKRKRQEVTVSGTSIIPNGYDYWTYERESNFKINTDSYTKILLSDYETSNALSGVIYTDFKGELSLNITRLEQEFEIPIKFTTNFGGKVYVMCSEKHGLKDDDGVVLEFNGGDYSSEILNQEYFGYQTVTVVNEFDFIANVSFGQFPQTGQDTGVVRYIKSDPFLGFEPIDLIDLGVDNRGKIAIETSAQNLGLIGNRNFLFAVDLTKFRYRLIDGLDLDTLSTRFPWILEAEISAATIGLDNSRLCWYKGIWECGRWFDGRWISGLWISGDWYGGLWDSKDIDSGIIKIKIKENSYNELQSTWYSGRWFGGTWNGGRWFGGRWYGGTWNRGIWFRGIWNDGTWETGEFKGGIWVLGTWNGGRFNCSNEPAYWVDGVWYSGDFENGIWYNGTFDNELGEARFGVRAFNSRTAIWHSGNWKNGSFYSRINIDGGQTVVSEIHKYSIWYTGNWVNGDFYGGIAYHMNWQNGTWHGGILEEVQIIGYGTDGLGRYYFTLNGIFKFNIGDQFKVIDNQFGTSYSTFGSNVDPKTYIVLDIEELPQTKYTKVFVNLIINSEAGAPNSNGIDTTLRVVSNFKNCNWKSGIWTNGIYENGIWEGGIWYNGIFNATWM
jgi:hypothetical protein